MFIKKMEIKFKDYKFNKKMSKQRYKKGFADCDCWDMHYWFTSTFPKMIRTLRDMKHGAPEYDFEEFDNFPLLWVAEESKENKKKKRKKHYEEEINVFGKDKCFDRWWFVLSRIAYCLEQADEETTIIENEYAEEYNRQIWGDDSDIEGKHWTFEKWWNKHHVVEEYDEKGKPKLYRLVTNDPDPELKEKFWNREQEIADYRESMKDEAFDLIKKYFWSLWD